MIEVSGLWANRSVPKAVTRYTSPGPWQGDLEADQWDGEDVYLEYEPVFAVLDLESMAVSEYTTGEAKIRNMVIPGAEKPLNNIVYSSGSENRKYMAGYAAELARVFLFYRTIDGSYNQHCKHFLLSPLAGTVLGSLAVEDPPNALLLWAGNLISFDGWETTKL